jgi:SAM-dependent methyltransferase
VDVLEDAGGMSIPFVDPSDRRLPLQRREEAWVSPLGKTFPIVDGVADFTATPEAGQAQTADSFGYKWNKQPEWGFGASHQQVMDQVWSDVFGWEPGAVRKLMENRVVLDAGCGSGASLNQFIDYPSQVAAVDISSAVYACRNRFGDRSHVTFARADLTALPFADGAFDVIWSAGVLHHTPDTRRSLESLVRHLRPGGRIVFYVYRKKAPLREFADDHVRELIADLPPDEAWHRMEHLTKLARSLSSLKATLVVEEDVEELGFEKGTYDLQRFIYYNVFKCFWNDALSFDDNVHVNFDWYHPRYAHRHTPEEVRGWLGPLGLRDEHFHVSGSGIAVVAVKASPMGAR